MIKVKMTVEIKCSLNKEVNEQSYKEFTNFAKKINEMYGEGVNANYEISTVLDKD